MKHTLVHNIVIFCVQTERERAAERDQIASLMCVFNNIILYDWIILLLTSSSLSPPMEERNNEITLLCLNVWPLEKKKNRSPQIV